MEGSCKSVLSGTIPALFRKKEDNHEHYEIKDRIYKPRIEIGTLGMRNYSTAILINVLVGTVKRNVHRIGNRI
jgi:hypothetical protein